MNLRLIHIVLLLTCLFSLPLMAQEEEENSSIQQYYNQAEEAYNLGRLDLAKSLLEDNIKAITSLNSTFKLRYYRLLSLCCLALDQTDKAEEYAIWMLKENPYYTPTVEYSPRFSDMIEQIKNGTLATISTASSHAENLNEAPVPTTLITEEMIRNSGARNLQEVLATYVPGIFIVDCNDDINISMRGIYSNGQEKILIMLNGHRLNSYCTNIASPDFSISLEKLKQIEVLRGPASSLYGGVALTAVVNLITKQGADVDGARLSGGIGNYGQMRGDVYVGKRYFDLDMMIWGSIYKAKGEKRHISMIDEDAMDLKMKEGDAIIGGIGDKPSYDFGVTLKWENLKFMYNTQFSQIISPFTMSFLNSPYTIDRYKTYNGIRPSFATSSHHADLSYEHKFGNLSLKGSVTYDYSDLTHYQVISDDTISYLANLLNLPQSILDVISNSEGVSRYMNAQESTLGAQLKGDLSYLNKSGHKGFLTLGAEYVNFHLNDIRYAIGYDFNKTMQETPKIAEIGKGTEDNINTFLQLKHQYKSLILNAGLRFDHKKRYDHSYINELSPRAALIFVRPKWNAKLSFSKSYTDAPYFYRKTNAFLATFDQSFEMEELRPEQMHSWQLTFGSMQWIKNLYFEFNFFHNHAKDLIFMELIEHENTGDIKNYGVEFTGHYQLKNFSANLSVEWQQVEKSTIFDNDNDIIYNTPDLTVSTVLAWRPFKNLKLTTSLYYASSQQNYKINLFAMALSAIGQKMMDEAETDEEREFGLRIYEGASQAATQISKVDPRILCNLGAEYQFGRVQLGLNVSNVFNTRYSQGGMSTGLNPQRGRWFMATIGIDL